MYQIFFLKVLVLANLKVDLLHQTDQPKCGERWTAAAAGGTVASIPSVCGSSDLIRVAALYIPSVGRNT